jgi:hypothetical protein
MNRNETFEASHILSDNSAFPQQSMNGPWSECWVGYSNRWTHVIWNQNSGSREWFSPNTRALINIDANWHDPDLWNGSERERLDSMSRKQLSVEQSQLWESFAMTMWVVEQWQELVSVRVEWEFQITRDVDELQLRIWWVRLRTAEFAETRALDPMIVCDVAQSSRDRAELNWTKLN